MHVKTVFMDFSLIIYLELLSIPYHKIKNPSLGIQKGETEGAWVEERQKNKFQTLHVEAPLRGAKDPKSQKNTGKLQSV